MIVPDLLQLRRAIEASWDENTSYIVQCCNPAILLWGSATLRLGWYNSTIQKWRSLRAGCGTVVRKKATFGMLSTQMARCIMSTLHGNNFRRDRTLGVLKFSIAIILAMAPTQKHVAHFYCSVPVLTYLAMIYCHRTIAYDSRGEYAQRKRRTCRHVYPRPRQ